MIYIYLSAVFPGNFSGQEEKNFQTNVRKIFKSGSSACSCMLTPSYFSVVSLGVKL